MKMILIKVKNFGHPKMKRCIQLWQGYIDAIKETDQYVIEIWNFIQNDIRYKNKTTLIVTNDHGLHLETVLDGFVSEGCRKIQCQVFSPDTEKGIKITTAYNQTNIAPTIAYLMNVPSFYEGKTMSPMWDLFKK